MTSSRDYSGHFATNFLSALLLLHILHILHKLHSPPRDNAKRTALVAKLSHNAANFLQRRFAAFSRQALAIAARRAQKIFDALKQLRSATHSTIPNPN